MSMRTCIPLLLICLALWGLAGRLEYEDERAMAAAQASGHPVGGLHLACQALSLANPSAEHPGPNQARVTTPWLRVSSLGANPVPSTQGAPARPQELRCVVLDFDEED